METSYLGILDFSELWSKASEEFDYIAGIHICMKVQVHSVTCLPDVFKFKKKKYTLILLSFFSHYLLSASVRPF